MRPSLPRKWGGFRVRWLVAYWHDFMNSRSKLPPMTVDLIFAAKNKTQECLDTAAAYYGRTFLLSECRFDLTGNAAGMLVRSLKQGTYVIRYNRILLEAHPEHLLNQTAHHEVSHLCAYQLFGPGIKPHGKEWQSVMRDVFGLKPDRCHSLDTSAATVTPYIYSCGCTAVRLVSKRSHSKFQRSRYVCQKCKERIAFAGEREVERYRPAPATRLLVSSVGASLTHAHMQKIKDLLSGAEIIEAVLHGEAAVGDSGRRLAKVLSIKVEQLSCHGSHSSIPDNLSHAIFFIDAPTGRQMEAISRLRSRGARVRVLKHPQRDAPAHA